MNPWKLLIGLEVFLAVLNTAIALAMGGTVKDWVVTFLLTNLVGVAAVFAGWAIIVWATV